MTSLLEQRYRRVLRLLPAGYRKIWEEDMVAAFLDSAESDSVERALTRPTMAEWLSVASLAVRLRLNGSHAAARWALWYRVAFAIALLVLLYQAVAATVTAGSTIRALTQDANIGPWYSPFLLSRFIGLLWVPAFAALVLRRVAAARILAGIAALASLGVTLAVLASYGPSHLPVGLGDVSRWGWLALSAAVVFVIPVDAKASPWLWFGAWLVGSSVVLSYELRLYDPRLPEPLSGLRIGDLTSVSNIALLVAMAVAIGRAWPMRAAGTPEWLFALGIVAAGIGGIRLARWSERLVPPFATPEPMSPSTMLAIILTALAVVALAVGLLGWRHSIADTSDA